MASDPPVKVPPTRVMTSYSRTTPLSAPLPAINAPAELTAKASALVSNAVPVVSISTLAAFIAPVIVALVLALVVVAE